MRKLSPIQGLNLADDSISAKSIRGDNCVQDVTLSD